MLILLCNDHMQGSGSDKRCIIVSAVRQVEKPFSQYFWTQFGLELLSCFKGGVGLTCHLAKDLSFTSL